MKITVDTEKMSEPNEFGEALREYCFVSRNEWDFGCYSTFELLPEFDEIGNECEEASELIKNYLLYTAHEDTDDYDEELKWLMKRTKVHTNGDIVVAWYWDGDGTLLFKEGNKVAINDDCKKTDEWYWHGEK